MLHVLVDVIAIHVIQHIGGEEVPNQTKEPRGGSPHTDALPPTLAHFNRHNINIQLKSVKKERDLNLPSTINKQLHNIYVIGAI